MEKYLTSDIEEAIVRIANKYFGEEMDSRDRELGMDSDIEKKVQELREHLKDSLSKFDERRGKFKPFAITVLTNKAKDILEEEGLRPVSLDKLREVAEKIGVDKDKFEPRDEAAFRDIEKINAGIDKEILLSKLTPKQRKLTKLLYDKFFDHKRKKTDYKKLSQKEGGTEEAWRQQKHRLQVYLKSCVTKR